MNIFYLHQSPYIAAKLQYNKHVVKMILESAQMLCTAHHVYGNAEQKLNVPYKQAHLNHPSTIWTRQCRANYRWLYLHMLALGNEYTERYGKTHLTIHKCAEFLNVPPAHIPDGDFCEPPQAMPDEYKVPGDSIKAYWNYYIGDKSHIANPNKEKIYENNSIIFAGNSNSVPSGT
jgi:hypothetical protein